MKKPLMKQIIIILITAMLSSTLTLGYVYKENFSAMYLQKIIEENYYGEIDEDKLAEGAMTGIVASLEDEHSFFVDAETGYNTYREELDGEFSGVGMQIAQTEEGCLITTVFKGSPASKQGLMVGDIITGVNGEDVLKMNPTEISNRVKGEIGTSVSITVERNNESLTFELMRAKVNIPTVETKKYDNVAYVKVTEFNSGTDEDFKAALEEAENCDGVIVDLRNNGGGLLDTTVNMLDMVINEGDFITTKYTDGEFTYKASGKQIYTKPMVVLVNGFSASASEFFSAAVKENDRGEVVGTTTYGKGSIQSSFRLPDNRGVHLTIGRFYSPKGNEINKVGVTPDHEIKNPEAYELYDVSAIPFSDDLQLKKAIELIKNKK